MTLDRFVASAIVIQRNDDAIIDGCTRTAGISCPCIFNDVGILTEAQHNSKFFGLRALRRVLEFDGDAGLLLHILGPWRIAKVCEVVRNIAVQCGVPEVSVVPAKGLSLSVVTSASVVADDAVSVEVAAVGGRTAFTACQRSADHSGRHAKRQCALEGALFFHGVSPSYLFIPG